jgi:hypothetical protein
MGIHNNLQNVFMASMTSGLIYSVITMPFESAKNRMAFQKPDPATGVKPYRSALQTMRAVAASEVDTRCTELVMCTVIYIYIYQYVV